MLVTFQRILFVRHFGVQKRHGLSTWLAWSGLEEKFALRVCVCLARLTFFGFSVASVFSFFFSKPVKAQDVRSVELKLEPPKLLRMPSPLYTDEARTKRIEGTVLLRLAVGSDGQVTQADVLRHLGYGLDEAAQKVALESLFVPARRGMEAMASRVDFQVTFSLPTLPEGMKSRSTEASSVSVKVRDENGAAVAGARLSLVRDDGSEVGVFTSNESGSFRFGELAPGFYRVRATLGERRTEARVEAVLGEDRSVKLRFEPSQDPLSSPPGQPGQISHEPAQVTVRHQKSKWRQRLESAEAVNLVDLKRARSQSADLSEVMARTQGVGVRRSGALGSGMRFSLNGLYDDQIRFFLDGVPLDSAGYPFGLANVPVNLVEGVEIYRGVVPIRFGADALGGAVNLVTDESDRPRLGLSYQVGSFGTHRLTLDGRYKSDKSGFVARGSAFFDVAKNNYPIDVDVADERGRLRSTTVRRFHDRYLAYGASVEVGFVDKPWARRLLLRGFASTYDKDLQHNVVMTVPYGEVTYGETVVGGTARYEQTLMSNLELFLLANYARRTIQFSDRSQWVYNWFGQRIRERYVLGEIDGHPTDQTFWQDTGFGKVDLEWAPHHQHVVRLVLSPTYTTRTGKDHIQTDLNVRDPLTAGRDLFTFVSGLEYELNAFPNEGAPADGVLRRRGKDYALQNSFFIKDYMYYAHTEKVLPGQVFLPLSQNAHVLGVGDAFRFRFKPWLYAKASYEYATRLPSPSEVFGNGVLITSNLELKPELSHNTNLGVRAELKGFRAGEITLDINAFWRQSSRLIVLLGSEKSFSYQNVYEARALGVESAFSWVSPGRFLTLDGTFTFQDVRNVSDEGTFSDVKGDRIPNRPWLFGSFGARLRIPNLPRSNDVFEPFFISRYVHKFYRGWESQGLREFKQIVDSQLTHTVGLSYTVSRDTLRLTTTFEVDNVTDSAVYDFFGVQRPGRAFFFKTTGEM